MAPPRLSPAEDARTLKAWELAGHSQMATARLLGISRSALQSRMLRLGLFQAPPPPGPALPDHLPTPARPDTAEATTAPAAPHIEAVKRALKKSACSIDDLAAQLGISRGQALDACDALDRAGINVTRHGDDYHIASTQATPEQAGRHFEYVSRADNTFFFGCASDNHIGSKYERNDILADLYDKFAANEVDRVFNAGNWIDGECAFNQHDIYIHGLNNQLDYLAKQYPQRPGIKTYAITGEDHEGWYSRRESIDVGKLAQRTFEDAGRDDWVDLGFMEAKIDLVNANTGKTASLVVMHPGGGSAYATSYRPQKIVEALEGGEKPAVLLIGHYHKLSVNLVRNVWTLQIGCTEDQTPFMRKKNIDAHIGGMMVQLEQDPATGAITSCTPRIYRYFNKAYYNDRWARDGQVVLPQRKVA